MNIANIGVHGSFWSRFTAHTSHRSHSQTTREVIAAEQRGEPRAVGGVPWGREVDVLHNIDEASQVRVSHQYFRVRLSSQIHPARRRFRLRQSAREKSTSTPVTKQCNLTMGSSFGP